MIATRLEAGQPLAGFGSSVYPKGDPRGRSLMLSCHKTLGADPLFRKFDAAVALVRAETGLEPNIALVAMFVGRVLGLCAEDSLFLVGRSIG